MLDDRAVLATIAAGVAILVFQLRKRGARGRRLFAAGWVAFFGLTLVVMMGAHSIDIVLHGIRTGSRLNGEPWRYDFQMYALHLLSAVLVWQGIRALRGAVALAETGADVGRQALRPVPDHPRGRPAADSDPGVLRHDPDCSWRDHSGRADRDSEKQHVTRPPPADRSATVKSRRDRRGRLIRW